MNPQHVVQYHVEYSKLHYFVSIHGVHVKRHLYMVSSNGYESKWNHQPQVFKSWFMEVTLAKYYNRCKPRTMDV